MTVAGTPHIFPDDAENLDLVHVDYISSLIRSDKGIDAMKPEIVHPIDTKLGQMQAERLKELKAKMPYAIAELKNKLEAGDIEKDRWGYSNWWIGLRGLDWRSLLRLIRVPMWAPMRWYLMVRR